MSMIPQSFTEEEKRQIRALLGALAPFQAMRSTIPLQYLCTFLQVALEEGLGVTEYATIAGVPPAVMTRHLLDLGERNRAKQPGYGLVMQASDHLDLRKHRTVLTPAGRAMTQRILAQCGLGSPAQASPTARASG